MGKTVDDLNVQLKENSARDKKMDVDSPGNVVVTRDFSLAGGSPGIYYLPQEEIKLRGKVIEMETKMVDLLTKVTSELTSGKILKPEFKLWLANVENIVKESKNRENKLAMGKFKDYEASGRILMVKMEEADEVYMKGKLAESVLGKENAGESSNQSKRNSSGVGNEGGKNSIVGMGGVGDTRIDNNSPVTMTFGNIQS